MPVHVAPDPHPGRQAHAVTRGPPRSPSRWRAGARPRSRPAAARLNDLNVYPVPDGDTGSNLAETARELAIGLEADPAARGRRSPPRRSGRRWRRQREQRRHPVPDRRRLRRGRRGRPGASTRRCSPGRCDPRPTPRTGPCSSRSRAPCSPSSARWPRRPSGVADRPLERGRRRRCSAEGEASVVRTQGMLDVLRDAGVVDAGRRRAARVRPRRVRRAPRPGGRGPHRGHRAARSASRRCTSSSRGTATARRFCVEGDGIDRDGLERTLLAMGDCLLVVGEAPLVQGARPHRRPRARPSRPRSIMGAIDRVAIANMQVQTEERERRLAGERHLTALPGGRSSDAPHDRREHRDRARLDGRHAASRRRAAELAHRCRSPSASATSSSGTGSTSTPAAFYGRLRDGGAAPATAAPSPGRVRRARSRSWPTSPTSSSCPSPRRCPASGQAARIAADTPEAGGRVTVLDGLTVSAGTVLLAAGRAAPARGRHRHGRGHGVGRRRPASGARC